MVTCKLSSIDVITLTLTHDCSNKAVADGAVSFYIDHLVSSRVARTTYGINITTRYNSQDPEHRARKHTQFISLAGHLTIPNKFGSILLKVNMENALVHSMDADMFSQGTQVSELREFRRSFSFSKKSRAACASHSVNISCYKGDLQEPKWMDTERCMACLLLDQAHADSIQFSLILHAVHDSCRPLRAIPNTSAQTISFRSIGLLFG